MGKVKLIRGGQWHEDHGDMSQPTSKGPEGLTLQEIDRLNQLIAAPPVKPVKKTKTPQEVFDALPDRVRNTIIDTCRKFLGRDPTLEEIHDIYRRQTWQPQCRKCGDTGSKQIYTETGSRGIGDWRYDFVPCDCETGRSRVGSRCMKRLVRISGWMDDMAPLTFANFDRRREPEAFDAAKAFANDPNGWLVLWGYPGTGKTHLLAALMQVLIDQGRFPVYMVAPDLLDALRQDIHNDDATTFDDLRQCDVLIIDDLGKEKRSAWSDERWYALLDHRYRRHLPTVVATNLDLTAPDALDEAVISRLMDLGRSVVIQTTSEDFRRIPARAKSRRKTQGGAA